MNPDTERALSRDLERSAYLGAGAGIYGPSWYFALAAATWIISFALLFHYKLRISRGTS